MPTLAAAACLADVPKWGWGGRAPGRAAPRVALSKQYSSPGLGDGKTGERVGSGPGGPRVQLCIFRGVLRPVPAAGVSVCEPPLPRALHDL